MTAGVLSEVSALLARARKAYAKSPHEQVVRDARARLDEPLRVAVAGKVKAGKSTLLNALVGERLAPTDAGECTRIVTWYVDSHTSRVTVEPFDDKPRQAPFARDNGSIEVQLGGLAPEAINRMVVEWPSASLREMTLIDTPGIDSLSTDISDRTFQFLVPDDDQPRAADAVVYLMRHFHGTDVRLLEAFHDDATAMASPINAIGVLSRADEIGVGQIDAMETAGRIATRYSSQPEIRKLCQVVVPMAGLLAETAVTLRQDEYQALALLAVADPGEAEQLLLSVDRFAFAETAVDLPSERRVELLRRLGVFGVRLGVELLRSGRVTSAPDLADELRKASGLDGLRGVLTTQFAQRRDVLKARAALTLLDALVRESPPRDGAATLSAEIERIESAAHEFAELRLLNALRTGGLQVPDLDAAERLLGSSGVEPAARLGLPPGASREELRAQAGMALTAWKTHAEDPLASRDSAGAAEVLVRTCEGLVTALL